MDGYLPSAPAGSDDAPPFLTRGNHTMFEGLFRPTHLLLILAVALLVYGPKKLPQLGEALGKTMRDFKKAVNDKAGETTPESTSQEAKRLQDRNG